MSAKLYSMSTGFEPFEQNALRCPGRYISHASPRWIERFAKRARARDWSAQPSHDRFTPRYAPYSEFIVPTTSVNLCDCYPTLILSF